MLAATHRKLRGGRFVEADATALPFSAETFDLVWASYLLDLIPTGELVTSLAEFRRVLRRGGRLLLVNSSKNNERLTLWERAYRHTPSWLVPYLFGGCRPNQAAPFLQQAGFRCKSVSQVLSSEIIIARKPDQPVVGRTPSDVCADCLDYPNADVIRYHYPVWE